MPALLSTLLAQDTAKETLRRALTSGRVHHAYLFDGPAGVGKELAAFGLAQALVCTERRGPDACGVCSACTRALPRAGQARPVHPDILVIERGLYDPAQIGRRTPETQEISIDQVRTLVLARAAFGPHEGHAKVFIVRRAEELSTAAANALLKTLEEPGPKTHFILLTTESDTLLPTIRSRTQRVRFGYLPDDVVLRLLVARGVAPEQAKEVAKLAGGSVEAGEALADPDESEQRAAFVQSALRAIDAPDLGAALDLAEEAKKTKAGLDVRLAALATALASSAAAAANEGRRDTDVLVSRYRLALAARRQIEWNGSAQMVVESMITRMRQA